MIALDTSFLLDYLDGADAAREFLDGRESVPLFAPSLSLFETYRGGARAVGPEGVARIAESLDWVEPLPLTAPAAREAATIEAELLDAGQPVNMGDLLIAGVCRHHGARLVTRDAEFDRIAELETIEY